MNRLMVRSAFMFCALFLQSHAVQADEVEDFYRDKRIELFISSTAGGGNDLSARLIARFLPNHIPGRPGIVPRNLPGAGGVTAANHIYNIAPRDGTAIGMIQNSALFEPLYGNDKAKFDIQKTNWIGSPSMVCVRREVFGHWTDPASPYRWIDHEYPTVKDTAWFADLYRELAQSTVRRAA